MDKKVIVLTPNGRRQNIKILPNTTFLQVLEEASVKHGFDSDEYCLLHHNREIDLTLPFRFSGLPNNALVEMKQMEKKRAVADVNICLQLEDGSRLQGEFHPSRNLWHVIEHLSAEASQSYENPAAIYMRQEVVGKEQMQSTTLKSMGITEGRAMIRFLNKSAEQLKMQANVYVAPVVKETPKADDDGPRNARTSAAGAGGFAITKDLVQSLKKTAADTEAAATNSVGEEKQEMTKAVSDQPKYDWGSGTGRTMRKTDAELAAEEAAERAERERLQAEMDIEVEYNIIGDRNAVLYSLDSTQKQIEELPDSFFELTVQDLKLVLRDLKRIASGNEDAPLLTEKLRELQEQKTMLNKIGQYKNCVIRIQLPDRHVLQGMFKPIDTVSDVMEFVRGFLYDKQTSFHLFTIPPKTVLSLEKTLLELDFVPTAVVHFGTEEEMETRPFVAPEFLSKITTAEGALYAASKLRTLGQRKISTETNNNHDEMEHQPSTSTGAIPKRRRNEAQYI